MSPVPSDLGNTAAMAAFLEELVADVRELLNPTQPRPLWQVASSSLPRPASAWRGCYVDLTDIGTAAKSDGTNWIRIDTGGTL